MSGLNRQRALHAANLDSVLRGPDGRLVELKAHQAAWSGTHPENSLAALRECYDARVARVEIDFLFRGDDLVVTHDEPRRGAKLPSLREALEVVRSTADGPTVLMLDAKGDAPWPKDRVTQFLRLVEPVRHRIFVGSPADWNLRRLREADPDLTLAFDPQYYLTWSSKTEKLPGRVGAYGYQDTHPLALRRTGPTADYLRERFAMLLALVPNAREVHLRLGFFERLLDDGFDAAKFLHDAGKLVDVWTIDAGTRHWRERVARAVAAGTDIVTTNTPRKLAAAFRERDDDGESPDL
jgi:glycerophosphoryl diester phosphodiesterase